MVSSDRDTKKDVALRMKCPERDLNPRQRRERPLSLTGLDDRGVKLLIAASFLKLFKMFI